MTVLVEPSVEVEKGDGTTIVIKQLKQAKNDVDDKGLDSEELLKNGVIINDDSFASTNTKPIKIAISILTSKITLLRELLERIHSVNNQAKPAEHRCIDPVEKYRDERSDQHIRVVEMCAVFSNVLFSMVWFTLFVFTDWMNLSLNYGVSILVMSIYALPVVLLGTLLLGTYAHENAHYARETRQYKRAILFGLFDIGFVCTLPIAVSTGFVKIKSLFGRSDILEGFSLLDALSTVRVIPIMILIVVVLASFSSIALSSPNKIKRRFWTLDRITKNTVEYERIQAFWMIVHMVGNIPTLAMIPEALTITLMLVALIAVERIVTFALSGIEERKRNKLIPLMCFNFLAAISFAVLFFLNPFAGPFALEIAVAFITVINLVLGVTRWREYGKRRSVEAQNCRV
ncbi:unnamed protein product [Anisakis simplex]|uniref:Ubiquitin-like domain-containing protein n=1 Tax=Anisakis simplex TaxID=6269 RepID=A0A158PPB9_ANISI|nr:unnamed protein product [Anisakis simplex]